MEERPPSPDAVSPTPPRDDAPCPPWPRRPALRVRLRDALPGVLLLRRLRARGAPTPRVARGLSPARALAAPPLERSRRARPRRNAAQFSVAFRFQEELRAPLKQNAAAAPHPAAPPPLSPSRSPPPLSSERHRLHDLGGDALEASARPRPSPSRPDPAAPAAPNPPPPDPRASPTSACPRRGPSPAPPPPTPPSPRARARARTPRRPPQWGCPRRPARRASIARQAAAGGTAASAPKAAKARRGGRPEAGGAAPPPPPRASPRRGARRPARCATPRNTRPGRRARGRARSRPSPSRERGQILPLRRWRDERFRFPPRVGGARARAREAVPRARRTRGTRAFAPTRRSSAPSRRPEAARETAARTSARDRRVARRPRGTPSGSSPRIPGLLAPAPSLRKNKNAVLVVVVPRIGDAREGGEFARGVRDGVQNLQGLPRVAPSRRERLPDRRGARQRRRDGDDRARARRRASASASSSGVGGCAWMSAATRSPAAPASSSGAARTSASAACTAPRRRPRGPTPISTTRLVPAAALTQRGDAPGKRRRARKRRQALSARAPRGTELVTSPPLFIFFAFFARRRDDALSNPARLLLLLTA